MLIYPAVDKNLFLFFKEIYNLMSIHSLPRLQKPIQLKLLFWSNISKLICAIATKQFHMYSARYTHLIVNRFSRHCVFGGCNWNVASPMESCWILNTYFKCCKHKKKPHIHFKTSLINNSKRICSVDSSRGEKRDLKQSELFLCKHQFQILAKLLQTV